MEKNNDTIIELLESQATELLSQMKVDHTLRASKEDDESYRVDIDTPDSGLLIGYHGEVINSLQLILGILVYRKTNAWTRFVVNIGDYRQKREEIIRSMTLEKAKEVESTGQEVALAYLSPLERRIVHMVLSDHPKVTSQSEGEGKDRRVILRLK
jgi:spoIIIJ-associated protein